jgi:hypothetical protein
VSSVIDFLVVRIIIFTSSQGRGADFDGFFEQDIKWRGHTTARINRDKVYQVLYDKSHYFPGSTQYSPSNLINGTGTGYTFSVAPATAAATYGDMSKRISINLKGIRREVIFNNDGSTLKNERDKIQMAIIGTDGNNTAFTEIGRFFINTRIYFTG